MWNKNIIQPRRPQVATQHMRIACLIPKTTNTHSEYVILIAFILQQWLHERVSMLYYTYIACIVNKQSVFYSWKFRFIVKYYALYLSFHLIRTLIFPGSPPTHLFFLRLQFLLFYNSEHAQRIFLPQFSLILG